MIDKTKIEKIVSITKQDLDYYGIEVASCCVLNDISIEELRMILRRVEMLEEGIENVIKENTKND